VPSGWRAFWDAANLRGDCRPHRRLCQSRFCAPDHHSMRTLAGVVSPRPVPFLRPCGKDRNHRSCRSSGRRRGTSARRVRFASSSDSPFPPDPSNVFHIRPTAYRKGSCLTTPLVGNLSRSKPRFRNYLSTSGLLQADPLPEPAAPEPCLRPISWNFSSTTAGARPACSKIIQPNLSHGERIRRERPSRWLVDVLRMLES